MPTEAERRRQYLLNALSEAEDPYGVRDLGSRLRRYGRPTAVGAGVSPLVNQLAGGQQQPVETPLLEEESQAAMMHPSGSGRRSPRLDTPERIHNRTQGAYDAMRAVDPRVGKNFGAFEAMLAGVPPQILDDPRIQRYIQYNKGLAARGVGADILAANGRRVAVGTDPDMLGYQSELLNQLGGRIHEYRGTDRPRIMESQLDPRFGIPTMVDITPMSVENYSKMAGAQRDRDIGQASLMQGKASLLEAKNPPGGTLPAAIQGDLLQRRLNASGDTSGLWLKTDANGNVSLNDPHEMFFNVEQKANENDALRKIAAESPELGVDPESIPTGESVWRATLQTLRGNESYRQKVLTAANEQSPTSEIVKQGLQRLDKLAGKEPLETKPKRRQTLMDAMFTEDVSPERQAEILRAKQLGQRAAELAEKTGVSPNLKSPPMSEILRRSILGD